MKTRQGLSFLYQAAACAQEPCPASYLSIAAAGADFLVEEPGREALAQQQAESEREGAALHEIVTSQSAQLRELMTL